MTDDFTPRFTSGKRSAEPHTLNWEVRRFWLEHGDAKISLEPRVYVLGRSSQCELMVDDTRASRRHARLVVRSLTVSIEDLGSSNGVFVNGVRITKACTLRDGDQFQLASACFVLKSEGLPYRNASETPATCPNLVTRNEPPSLSPEEAEAPTLEAHSLDLLGTLAEKSFALGRVDEAEHMLSNALDELLRRARAGRGRDVPPRIFAKAAHYAVLLADATQRGKWVDYAVALFDALEKPLPATIVDQLYVTVRKTTDVNRASLRAYVERLRECPDTSPADRFVIQRLGGLERQIAPK